MAVQGQEIFENLGLHRQAPSQTLGIFAHQCLGKSLRDEKVRTSFLRVTLLSDYSAGEPTLLIPYASTYADDRRHDD
jgi:hypothetical protein